MALHGADLQAINGFPGKLNLQFRRLRAENPTLTRTWTPNECGEGFEELVRQSKCSVVERGSKTRS